MNFPILRIIKLSSIALLTLGVMVLCFTSAAVWSLLFSLFVGGIVGATITKFVLKKEGRDAPQTKLEYLPTKQLSHEVRTPLAAVVGTINYLIENPDKETIVESLETLTTSCLNLEAVVLDLLESSVDHEPKVFSSPSSTDISRLCSKLAHTLKEKALEKQISVTAQISPLVPADGIVDRIRAYQLLHRVIATVLHEVTTKNCQLTFEATKETTNESSLIHHLIIGINISPAIDGNLLPTAASNYINRLARTLDAELSQSRDSARDTISIRIPFKPTLSEGSDLALENQDDILIVVDDSSIAENITEILTEIGFSKKGVIESSRFLGCSLVGIEPKKIIIVLDSSHTNYLQLVAVSDKYPSGKVYFITDSLDESARRLLSQRRMPTPILLPLGIGDLQQRLLKRTGTKLRIGHSQSGLRVLVVDDVRLNRIVLAKHLESAGHEVVTATNGEEAISTLEKSGHFSSDTGIDHTMMFDMVIMDIDMPVLGGLAAAEKIRELENSLASSGTVRHVPIIAATADAVGNDYERFILSGMEWFITKPVDPNRLLQLVEHFGGIALRRQKEARHQIDAINLPWLQNQFGGDEEAVTEIIEAFIDEIDSLWLALFRGAINGTNDTIRANAHALKGSLQNVGAHAAAEIAKQVEQAAKSGKTTEARDLIESLVSQIKLAKECAIRLNSQLAAEKDPPIITV